jgi:hypothetical protein
MTNDADAPGWTTIIIGCSTRADDLQSANQEAQAIARCVGF